MSWLLREAIASAGTPVLATSRPEGVDEHEFGQSFVILSLQQLSEEQQRDAMLMQLRSLPSALEFTNHLLAFTNIRRQHDALWQGSAFQEQQIRFSIENVGAPDLLLLPERRGWDPWMRQCCIGGSRFIAPRIGPLQSTYLTLLDRSVRPRLPSINDHVMALPPNASEASVDSVLQSAYQAQAVTGLGLPPPEEHTKLIKKLALLLLKLRCRATAEACDGNLASYDLTSLWAVIVQRTDEIYVVALFCPSAYLETPHLKTRSPHLKTRLHEIYRRLRK